MKNEFKLKKIKSINSTFGVVGNNDEISVCYLRVKAKITPTKKRVDYLDQVNKAKRIFSTEIINLLKGTNEIQKDFIFNVDISDKSMKFGKPSFLRYEIYIKPKHKTDFDSLLAYFKTLSDTIDELLNNILNKETLELI